MALRGWRLFGVAGTLSVYLAGILLLSFMSLNGPPQRHHPFRNRYDFDAAHPRDAYTVAKRQPLQWCQPLRYLNIDASNKSGATKQQRHPRPRQTFPGHFVQPLDRRLKSIESTAVVDEEFSTIALVGPIQPIVDEASAATNRRMVVKRDGSAALHQPHDELRKDGEVQQKSKLNDNGIVGTARVTTRTTAAPAVSGRLLHQHLLHAARNKNKHTQRADQTEIKQLSDSKERNLVALASFPGSGNTWLRYLLQQATGIYTGSIYKDFGLLKSGFPAENVFNSSVLVVKTHEWGQQTYKFFSKAILLVRDPDKAIIAEFNRQSGGHVGFAAPDRYKRTKGRYWQSFFTKKLESWEQMHLHWVQHFKGELLIVYYDDLIADVEGILRSILKFINFPIDEEQLNCAVQRKEGIYRRKKRIMTFDPYTPEMHVTSEQSKRHVYSVLGRNRF